jgi:hypothetical protein
VALGAYGTCTASLPACVCWSIRRADFNCARRPGSGARAEPSHDAWRLSLCRRRSPALHRQTRRECRHPCGRSQGNEVAVEVDEPPNPGTTNLFRAVRVIARAVRADGITLRGRPRSATECAPDPPMSAAESVNVIAIRKFLGGLLHRASAAVWRRSEVAAVDLGNLAASLGCCQFHVVHERHSSYGQWLAEWTRGGAPRSHAPAVPVSQAGGGAPSVEESAWRSVRFGQSQRQCPCCRFLHNPSLKRTRLRRAA